MVLNNHFIHYTKLAIWWSPKEIFLPKLVDIQPKSPKNFLIILIFQCIWLIQSVLPFQKCVEVLNRYDKVLGCSKDVYQHVFFGFYEQTSQNIKRYQFYQNLSIRIEALYTSLFLCIIFSQFFYVFSNRENYFMKKYSIWR